MDNSKIASQAFPAFAIGFAAYYAPAYSFTGANSSFTWPLFTYFPAVDMWNWGLVPGNDTIGPPMWWYGWIASAALVGLVCAVIALLLPERAFQRILATLVWVIPLVAFVFLMNWELPWFFPTWRPIWFS